MRGAEESVFLGAYGAVSFILVAFASVLVVSLLAGPAMRFLGRGRRKQQTQYDIIQALNELSLEQDGQTQLD